MRSWLLAPFALDLRSLAAFRMALAALVLWDTFARALLLRDHYADAGILPRMARIANFDLSLTGDYQYWWSLHMMSGEPWGIGLLLALQAAAALCLLVGYRTRLAVIAAFVLVVSIQVRNPLILDGGDDLIKCLLFWSIFIPLGGLWSIDAALTLRRQREDDITWETEALGEAGAIGSESARSGRPATRPAKATPPHHAVLSLGTAALIVQIASVYLFSAVMKTGEEWYPDYTASYYAMHLDMFATSLGVWLRDQHTLLYGLTFATYWLEWIVPFLLFSPVKNAWCRMVGVLTFWAFHLGTILTLDIGLFPFVGMCAWIALLPGSFWDAWPGRLVMRVGAAVFGWLTRRLPGEYRWGAVRGVDRWFPSPETPTAHLNRAAKVFVAVMLVYVFLWNLRETNANYWEPRVLPNSLTWIGRLTHMDQSWGMFGRPPHSDGWFVMVGTLNDGTRVNLWDPGQPVTFARPTLVSRTLKGQRWRKYFSNIYLAQYANYREYFCEFLMQRWNDFHAGGDERKMVEPSNVVLYLMRENTPPPGEAATDVQRERLWPLAK
jgi:hypothetical protein